MILVDTSVWIDHLRRSDPTVASALDDGAVLVHPFVVGELACGQLTNRHELMRLLARLPMSPMATDAEVLAFIDERHLMGRGIGYIDVHLLASVMLAVDALLWTRDRRLAAIATQMGKAFQENTLN